MRDRVHIFVSSGDIFWPRYICGGPIWHKFLVCHINVKCYITRNSCTFISFIHTTVSSPSLSIIHAPKRMNNNSFTIIHGSCNNSTNTFSVAGAETLETRSFLLTTGGARPALPRPLGPGTMRGGTGDSRGPGSQRTGPSPWPGTRGWSRSSSRGLLVESISIVTRTSQLRPLGQMSPRALSHSTKLS